VEPLDANQDIDDKYQEYGEPTLPPSQMRERMYHVIKHLKYSAGADAELATYQKHNYLLKKNDIIKLGRVKLKVKSIYNKDRAQAREKCEKRRKARLRVEATQRRGEKG